MLTQEVVKLVWFWGLDKFYLTGQMRTVIPKNSNVHTVGQLEGLIYDSYDVIM